MTEQPPAPAAPAMYPEVTVVVHPIDRDIHPTYPAGHRWAVMVGGAPPTDLSRCANAGHAGTESAAAEMGESHGACAARALRAMGVSARYGFLRLDYDPIPAEADQRPIGRWEHERKTD